MEKFSLEKELAKDLKLIKLSSFSDDRGMYIKAYSDIELKKLGIDVKFVEDNYLVSKKSSVRGLHYQKENPEAKLVRCLNGEILDIAVDLREGSATYKQVFKVKLSGGDNRMLYVPSGFAHGIVSLSESVALYKSSNYYFQNDQYGISILSKEINFDKILTEIGVEQAIITEKDKYLPLLKDI